MTDQSPTTRTHRSQTERTPSSVTAVLQQTVRDAQASQAKVSQLACCQGDLQPGDVIAGRHMIQCLLSEMPLAHLYLARHTSISTLSYIVKILKKEHLFAPELVTQFRKEASTIAQLRDVHTVRVTDMGTLPDGRPFLCREFYPGVILDDLVEQHGPQDEAVVRHIAVGVLASLSEAHALGIVHCDIQPRGIVLSEDPGSRDVRARVLDFGSSYSMDASFDPTATEESNPSVLLFAPQYTAPECLRGRPCPASDVYALGLTLAELLDGKAVYESGTFLAVAARQISAESAPLGPRARASKLASIIERATSKDLDVRYVDAAEMLRDLLNTTLVGDADFRRSLSPDFIARHMRVQGDVPPRSQPDLDLLLEKSRALVGDHDPIWATGGAFLENAPTAPKQPRVEAQHTPGPEDHPHLGNYHFSESSFRTDEAADHYRTQKLERKTAREAYQKSPESRALEESDRQHAGMSTVGFHNDAPKGHPNPAGTAVLRKAPRPAASATATASTATPFPVEQQEPQVAKTPAKRDDLWTSAVLKRPLGLTLRVLLIAAFIAIGVAILIGGLP